MLKYKNYLLWLITPQDNSEQELFKYVVDDYIRLRNEIEFMSEEEIILEINNQLSPYNLQIDGI